MKLILLILLVFIGCSGHKSTSTKKGFEIGVPDSIKQIGYQEPVSPNTALLILEIVAVYSTPKFICGSKKNNTCLVNVLEVKNSGMGIINRPIVNSQLLMSFLSLEPTLKAGSVIEAKTIEYLCLGTNSKTSYTVVNQKLKE